VTGLAEAGSTVTITTSGGTVLGTATADGNGNFTVTLNPPQTNGETCSRLLPIKPVTWGFQPTSSPVYHPAECASHCHRDR
jgi:hypothetical protein